MEPEAEFLTEWRDKHAPYHAGPSLEMRKGQVKAAGREILKVESRQWIHVEIQSSMGSSQKGTWSLALTLQDGTKKTIEDLPLKHKDWRDLETMVFVSDSNVKSAFYLDNLDIKNE